MRPGKRRATPVDTVQGYKCSGTAGKLGAMWASALGGCEDNGFNQGQDGYRKINKEIMQPPGKETIEARRWRWWWKRWREVDRLAEHFRSPIHKQWRRYLVRSVRQEDHQG